MEVMTASELEVFEQETNYQRFLHNRLEGGSVCCGAEVIDGRCADCQEPTEWEPYEN